LARERDIAVLFTEHDMDVVFATPTLIVLSAAALIARVRRRRARQRRGAGGLSRLRAMYGVLDAGPSLLAVDACTPITAARYLADVALDVAVGEVVVLLGRNGAGKSTPSRASWAWCGRRPAPSASTAPQSAAGRPRNRPAGSRLRARRRGSSAS